MEIKSTINIVLKDLAEARDLIDDLKNYPGVPLLQLELAKAKCRSAEDVIRLLSELSYDLPDSIVEDEIIPVEENSKPEAETIYPDSSIVEATNPDTAIVENINKDNALKEQKHEKISSVVDAIVNLKEREPSPEKREKEKDKGKKIVADKFSHLSSRINEQIGDQKKDTPGNTQISRPLTDLTREIGINDRFFFIREVFDGKQDDYQRVISDLNRVDNMEDAIRIIKDGTGNDPGDEPVQMLLDLVKRKISSSGHE